MIQRRFRLPTKPCAFCREGGEPVHWGGQLLAGPLDQQPLRAIGFAAFEIAMSRTNAHGRETGVERLTGSFSPAYFLPRLPGQGQSQIVYRKPGMPSIAAHLLSLGACASFNF